MAEKFMFGILEVFCGVSIVISIQEGRLFWLLVFTLCFMWAGAELLNMDWGKK